MYISAKDWIDFSLFFRVIESQWLVKPPKLVHNVLCSNIFGNNFVNFLQSASVHFVMIWAVARCSFFFFFSSFCVCCFSTCASKYSCRSLQCIASFIVHSNHIVLSNIYVLTATAFLFCRVNNVIAVPHISYKSVWSFCDYLETTSFKCFAMSIFLFCPAQKLEPILNQVPPPCHCSV